MNTDQRTIASAANWLATCRARAMAMQDEYHPAYERGVPASCGYRAAHPWERALDAVVDFAGECEWLLAHAVLFAHGRVDDMPGRNPSRSGRWTGIDIGDLKARGPCVLRTEGFLLTIAYDDFTDEPVLTVAPVANLVEDTAPVEAPPVAALLRKLLDACSASMN